ncbi:MAG: sulfurtransferase [Thiobacillus sp.]
MKKLTVSTAITAAWILGGGVALADSATPLVNVQWVKENACKPGVVILDIRNQLDGHTKVDYLRGHIPCAVYSDYMKDGWRTKVNNIPGMLPPVPALEKLIGSLGISNSDHVVIYSAGLNGLDMGSATRVYWTFKVLGDDNVSILDGGYAAYEAVKGNKIETGTNTPKPATFTASFRKDMVPGEADVAKAMKSGVVLVDNRPADQYLGVNRNTPAVTRNGTLPGAKNLPESWFTDNNGGAFRAPAELKALYKEAGVPLKGEEINFCNTGHWASLGWFVSSELLGNKSAKVYDGSMSQWSANASLPMVQKIKVQ